MLHILEKKCCFCLGYKLLVAFCRTIMHLRILNPPKVFGYSQDYLVPQNNYIDDSMINSNFEQSKYNDNVFLNSCS